MKKTTQSTLVNSITHTTVDIFS